MSEREREREREKREQAGANRARALKKHAKSAHLSVYIFARLVCTCTSK